MSEALWELYVLECADKTYYTGITNHLARRLSQHEAGLVRNIRAVVARL